MPPALGSAARGGTFSGIGGTGEAFSSAQIPPSAAAATPPLPGGRGGHSSSSPPKAASSSSSTALSVRSFLQGLLDELMQVGGWRFV